MMYHITQHAKDRFYQRFFRHSGIDKSRMSIAMNKILLNSSEYIQIQHCPFYFNKVSTKHPGIGRLQIRINGYHWFICRIEKNIIHVITVVRNFEEMYRA